MGKKKEFYNEVFISLNMFFFNLRVIGAVIEHFGDEIIKALDKKAHKVTFKDMLGDDGVWSVIFKKGLEFVKEELIGVLDDYAHNLLVKGMHDRVQDFIGSAFQGRYDNFSREIAYKLTLEIWNNIEEDEKVPTVQAVVGCLILILEFSTPKRVFVHDFWDCIQDEMNEEEDKEKEAEDTIDEEDIAEGAYESALAMIVLKVVKLRPLLEEDMLDRECEKLLLGEESRNLVKEFLSTGKNGFFKPHKGGACECAGEGTFLGNLFGKMCK